MDAFQRSPERMHDDFHPGKTRFQLLDDRNGEGIAESRTVFNAGDRKPIMIDKQSGYDDSNQKGGARYRFEVRCLNGVFHPRTA